MLKRSQKIENLVNALVGHGYLFCLNLVWTRLKSKVEILYLSVHDRLNQLDEILN